MTRRIIWSPESLRILHEIRAYCERRWGTRAAASLLARLRAATRILREYPRAGRVVDELGRRQLSGIHPFVLVYRIEGDTGSPDDRLGDVEILRIWHGAQERPPDEPVAE